MGSGDRRGYFGTAPKKRLRKDAVMKYDYKTIEKKWQDRSEKDQCIAPKDDFSMPEFYGLIEFPYPSGAAMHV